VPEWRLFGDSEDALLEFEEGPRIRFEVPQQWRLLEMRLEDSEKRRRWRIWIRASAGVVESREWGAEKD
jgi:hypothetical protein